MSEHEKALLSKAKKGDVAAFEQLIEAHEKRAYNIAYRFLKNQQDAEDVTQEALIRAFKNLKKFKEDALFSTWLYRIVTNVCIDFTRSAQRKATDSIDKKIEYDGEEMERQFADEKRGPDEQTEIKELKHMMQDAMQKLSDEQRIVLILRDMQGFSYDEIAQMTDTQLGTVKSRINRARLALKDILLEKRELFNGYFVK